MSDQQDPDLQDFNLQDPNLQHRESQHGDFEFTETEASEDEDSLGRAQKERVRRILSPRLQRTRPQTTYNVADFDEQGEHISPPSLDAEDFTQNSTSWQPELASRHPLHHPLHHLVPGYEIANVAGLCYCTVQAFPLDAARGPLPLGGLLDLPPALFHRFHPTFGLSAMADYRHAAFIDTETTGLGGGAGVYCFMVGVGTFEAYRAYDAAQLPQSTDPSEAPTHFVVRQFFMRNPAEEVALLVALADMLAPYQMTVTFNGRSFDLPLLRMRYAQNRRFLPLDRNAALLQADRPHLDLLMPARKVWRRRLQSCRLINLEQMILGLQRSEDDVPGQLIPLMYEEFVRTGHAEAMRRVFYHNNEDIVTMVALADHLSRAFADSPANYERAAVVTGMDWAGLGRAYELAGDLAQAESAYRRALDSVRNSSDRGDILRDLGELYKRQGQWPQATETWQDWITSVPGSDATPFIELAKYCEWERRDLEQAEMWTAWALHNLQTTNPSTRQPGLQHELQHRLARLQRKRAGGNEAS